MAGNFDGVAAPVVWLPVTEIGIYIYTYFCNSVYILGVRDLIDYGD